MSPQLFSPFIHKESQERVNSKSPKKERLIIRYMEDSNILIAMGRSVSLEVQSAYVRLFYQVKRHFLRSNNLTCYFHYTVINATSTKLLFTLFKLLDDARKRGNQIVVHWMIEEGDEELIDIGNDFRQQFDLDFRISVK